MNIIKHRVYVLEFDVWEPLEKDVNTTMQEIIARTKAALKVNTAHFHYILKSDERVVE